MKVVEETAANWEQLAYTLKFHQSVVRSIRRDNPLDCTSACEDILEQWLQGKEGTVSPVTWETFVEVLRDCNLVELARDLDEIIV